MGGREFKFFAGSTLMFLEITDEKVLHLFITSANGLTLKSSQIRTVNCRSHLITLWCC